MRNGFNILFSSFFVNRSLCSCEIWTGLVESSVIYLKKKIPLTGKQNSIFNIKKNPSRESNQRCWEKNRRVILGIIQYS